VGARQQPGRTTEIDRRLHSAAFQRNHGAIGDVLRATIGARRGDVLELGSGSGEHAVVFAVALPNVTWWPSERTREALDSIEAWADDVALPNLRPPVALDAAAQDWRLGEPGRPPSGLAAIVAVNVLHIAPIAVTEGMFREAARHLGPDGEILVYGPFMRDGRHTAESNAAFDRMLRAQDPAWGVRDMADLDRRARRHGLSLSDAIEMPVNNFVLRFRRTVGGCRGDD